MSVIQTSRSFVPILNFISPWDITFKHCNVHRSLCCIDLGPAQMRHRGRWQKFLWIFALNYHQSTDILAASHLAVSPSIQCVQHAWNILTLVSHLRTLRLRFNKEWARINTTIDVCYEPKESHRCESKLLKATHPRSSLVETQPYCCGYYDYFSPVHWNFLETTRGGIDASSYEHKLGITFMFHTLVGV